MHELILYLIHNFRFDSYKKNGHIMNKMVAELFSLN